MWLFQQSQVIIAGIKQRIEDRQGKKLEESSLSGGEADFHTMLCLPSHDF